VPTPQEDEISRLWGTRPSTIRALVEARPQYEQLCTEISYILSKRLRAAEVEFAAVTHRAKSLKSIAEKIVRKGYSNPLEELTDLAGVRVVYLYRSDLSAIDGIVNHEFKVLERIDKVEESGAERFGYGALHYLIKLGRRSSGARYEDLKHLRCELQIRTVLQDAWAIIDHHLSYKQEADVPQQLRRKLNSLSGLFETADDQFDRLREERRAYLRSVREERRSPERFLHQELNLDTFREFLEWQYPGMKIAAGDQHLSAVLERVRAHGVKSLAQLAEIIQRAHDANTACNSEDPFEFAAAQAARSVSLVMPVFRDTGGWIPSHIEVMKKYVHLVRGKQE
jgi:putative GTP pyrophosphokinase